MHAPTLFDVFSQLDEWRNLPNYQLERRADIYFALYLPAVLEQRFSPVRLHKVVVPEFPVHRELIHPEKRSNKSVKIDYALFSEELDRVFLVELKTDAESHRPEQDHYLQVCRSKGWSELVRGLLTICEYSTSTAKYFHLLRRLEQAGFVTLSPETSSRALRPCSSTPHKVFSDVSINSLAAAPKIDVVFVEPKELPCEDWCYSIGYSEFAKTVRNGGGELGPIFASYLQEWEEPPPRRSEPK